MGSGQRAKEMLSKDETTVSVSVNERLVGVLEPCSKSYKGGRQRVQQLPHAGGVENRPASKACSRRRTPRDDAAVMGMTPASPGVLDRPEAAKVASSKRRRRRRVLAGKMTGTYAEDFPPPRPLDCLGHKRTMDLRFSRERKSSI
jgi:hypothetical protein